jgi:hypothetical protein
MKIFFAHPVKQSQYSERNYENEARPNRASAEGDPPPRGGKLRLGVLDGMLFGDRISIRNPFLHNPAGQPSAHRWGPGA